MLYLVIKKSTCIVICSLFYHFSCFSQGGVFNKGKYATSFSVKECFNAKYYRSGFRADSLASSRILKGQRIWRTIGLDNKNNQQILNSGGACAQVNLFEIIKFGLMEKKLKAFASDDFSNSSLALSGLKIQKSLSYYDSSLVSAFNEQGDLKTDTVITKRFLLGSDIKTYLLKEDWILNSHTGKSEKHIVAIAPLIYNEQQEKTIALFWLYYPEWENLLACFEARNFYSHEIISYREVFEKRYFISRITKTNNFFDRKVKATYHGEDAALESELLKEKLNTAENDLFQY